MRGKVLLVCCALIVLLVIGKVFVLPMIDMEMMKAPLTNGLMALRNGDMRALRDVFTTNATFASASATLAAAAVLEANRASIETKELDTAMRFGGFTNLHRESETRVSADFTIIVYYEGDESGYHRVPIDKTGHVVLQQQGFMNWKIDQLSSKEPEFARMLRE